MDFLLKLLGIRVIKVHPGENGSGDKLKKDDLQAVFETVGISQDVITKLLEKPNDKS